ncbi:hypothetical protein LTR08_007335 [Meristemomyces frigidus]|nr:hypothetical protein LTR08_007335 [Meristemomyces frigidus]
MGSYSRVVLAAATSASASPYIPAKFLLEKPAFPADEFRSIVRSTGAMTTRVNLNDKAEVVQETLPGAAPTSTSAKFRDDFPAMPEWLVGLMAGLLAFGFVVAVVLYLANFPPSLSWVHSLRKRKLRRYGYTALGDGEDDSDGHRRSKSATVTDSSSGESGAATSSAGKGLARRRKNLSIDTSAHYFGLGIALPGDHEAAQRKRRRSYDEEATQLRHLKPTPSAVRTAWEAVTAPLPSASVFAHNISATLTGGPRTAAVDGNYTRLGNGDLEEGVAEGLRSDATDYATSPYKRAVQDPLYGPETRAEMDGFLGKLGSGVEHVAGRLTKALHDRVDGAEDGLLLSVKDCEREVNLT